MKNTLKILYIFVSLHLFVQCTSKYYLDEKYNDSYNLYGENVTNVMREYYVSMFKYPKTIDNVIKFIYDLSMSSADSYNDNYGFYIKMLTNLAQNGEYTQEEREKASFGFAAFNFICMYKDYISINIYNDSITVSCDIDGRNIFKVKSFKQNMCNERYDFHGSLFFYQNNKCVFLDTTEYPIIMNSDFQDSVFNELRNIAKNYSKSIIIKKEDGNYRKVAILSYGRNLGLSLLCPDDDIDLISDPYIMDIKGFLNDLLAQNPDIYEIIIPLPCYESKNETK
jgi:hypothetical protein